MQQKCPEIHTVNIEQEVGKGIKEDKRQQCVYTKNKRDKYFE